MIDFMKKIKHILITVGICVVIFIIAYVILFFSFENKLKAERELSYLKGKAETMLTDSETFLGLLNEAMINLKERIESYSKLLTRIEEVNNDVNVKMQSFKDTLTKFDTTFVELYNVWSNSGKRKQ